MKNRLLLSGVIIALLGWLAWWIISDARHLGKTVKKEAVVSVLFSGKEKKAAVRLYFVQADKSGFGQENSEIYLTQSNTARVKQVLNKFFAGPSQPSLRSAFPAQAAVREVFLDGAGLCVVDLTAETALKHVGGTTAEYQSLYTLFRTLRENFSHIEKIQLMVGGQRVPSLAGHLDIMDPLTKDYF